MTWMLIVITTGYGGMQTIRNMADELSCKRIIESMDKYYGIGYGACFNELTTQLVVVVE